MTPCFGKVSQQGQKTVTQSEGVSASNKNITPSSCKVKHHYYIQYSIIEICSWFIYTFLLAYYQKPISTLNLRFPFVCHDLYQAPVTQSSEELVRRKALIQATMLGRSFSSPHGELDMLRLRTVLDKVSQSRESDDEGRAKRSEGLTDYSCK